MARPTPRIELHVDDLDRLIERARHAPLSDDDYATLKAARHTLGTVAELVEAKGPRSPAYASCCLAPAVRRPAPCLTGRAWAWTRRRPPRRPTRPQRPATRGRRRATGAAAYPGAIQIPVAHPRLRHGDRCLGCVKGKVYAQRDPGVLIRILGQAPLAATVYQLEKLRCHLCGEVFTADPPPGVGSEKYDATSTSMVALLKYGAGVPFHRLARLQAQVEIPLPASTQWEMVAQAATVLQPVLHELIRHAGENLARVLAARAADLGPPIQMCDALSRNLPKPLAVVLGHCLAHARRKVVEVTPSLPAECRHILEALGEVYRCDDEARTAGLSPGERLLAHQHRSGPVLEDLHAWLVAQIDDHRIEPNSGLGQAIAYLRKHWAPLTLFLRVPGAPLDNNVCERALKKAILHRKNALFYRTAAGAQVGDLFMSLIHTCELAGANPFDYLTELLQHPDALAAAPSGWLPWTYRETRARSIPSA